MAETTPTPGTAERKGIPVNINGVRNLVSLEYNRVTGKRFSDLKPADQKKVIDPAMVRAKDVAADADGVDAITAAVRAVVHEKFAPKPKPPEPAAATDEEADAAEETDGEPAAADVQSQKDTASKAKEKK